MSTISFRKSLLFRFIAFTVLAAFAGMLPVQPGWAQVAIVMPPVGQMIHVTSHFEPPQMVGLKINLKDPFSFGFIMDQGENPMSDSVKKEEFNKIVKYFLVSLAMPNKDMWVNLSPYESKRIIPEVFAQTEMGRDLLAQDYVLKQFTASLMYPEDGLGKEFWSKVYGEAQARFGTTDINVNTFNKVWIVADHADVYQKGDTAFLVGSHLKVMLEQDFKAIEQNKEQFGDVGALANDSDDAKTQMASQVVREIIIPAIEKEVNEGQSFAAVRQIYNAEIMATWFKKTLRESLLGQVFADKSKIAGQRVSDPRAKEKIFQQYLRAYKRGVFNYIKREVTSDGQVIPRRYLSGGMEQVRDVDNYNSQDMAQLAAKEKEEIESLADKFRNQSPETLTRLIERNLSIPANSNMRPPEDMLFRPIVEMPGLSDRSRGEALATLAKKIFMGPNPTTSVIDRVQKLTAQLREQPDNWDFVNKLLNEEKAQRVAEAAARNTIVEEPLVPTEENLGKLVTAISTHPLIPQKDRVQIAATMVKELNTPTTAPYEEVSRFAQEAPTKPLYLTEVGLQSSANDNEPAPMANLAPPIEPVEQALMTVNQTTTTPAEFTKQLGDLLQNSDLKDLAEKLREQAEISEGNIKELAREIRDRNPHLLGLINSIQEKGVPGLQRETPENLVRYINNIAKLPESERPEAISRQVNSFPREVESTVRATFERISNMQSGLERNTFNALKPEMPERVANIFAKIVGVNTIERAAFEAQNRVAQEPTLRTPSLASSLVDIENNVRSTLGTVEPNVLQSYSTLQKERPKLVARGLQSNNESAGISDMVDEIMKMKENQQATREAVQAELEKIHQAHSAAVSAAGQLGLSDQLTQALANELIGNAAANGNGPNSLASSLVDIENNVRSTLGTVEPNVLQSYSTLQKERPKLVARGLQSNNESAGISDMVDEIMKMKENQQATREAVQAELEKIHQAHSAAVSAAGQLGLSDQLVQGLAQQMVSRASQENPGGINLSNEHLTLNIKVDGAGMPLPPQYQDPALMNINGLVSVIRSITPLTPQNVPALYELTK